MKSVFSWLITGLAVIFWIFRVIITIFATLKVDFIVVPSDINVEIALLFLTLPCLILIFKRKLLGGIIYFGLYGWYFGFELANILNNIFVNNIEVLSTDVVVAASICVLALFISLLNLFDIVLTKYRKSDNPSKKVDWFYKDKKFDRELDDRTDKNNYRIY